MLIGYVNVHAATDDEIRLAYRHARPYLGWKRVGKYRELYETLKTDPEIDPWPLDMGGKIVGKPGIIQPQNLAQTFCHSRRSRQDDVIDSVGLDADFL